MRFIYFAHKITSFESAFLPTCKVLFVFFKKKVTPNCELLLFILLLFNQVAVVFGSVAK